MKPIDAKTFDQICELEFDNIDTANGCALLLGDDEVSIYPPNNSAPYVSIPREDFEEMIEWYMEGKVPESDSRRKA